MRITKPEAIIFDWDNTLIDSWPVIHSSLEKTFIDFGLQPWSLEKVKKNVHQSLRDYFPKLFGDNFEKAGESYIKNFKKIHLEKLTALEHASETLDLLLKNSIPMFIVSNKTGDSLRKEVTALNWDKYFINVIGAKDAKYDKPSPDPVKMVLDNTKFDIGNNNIWFVGDSLSDIQCAYNCEFKAVLYGEKNIDDEDFVNFTPHFKIDDHTHFIKIINEF